MILRTSLLLVLLWTTLTSAQSPQLIIDSKTIHPPEMGPLTYLELKFGQETFTFVPPVTWRTQTDRRNATLQFFSPDGLVVIALRFTTNAARQVLASADAMRQQMIPSLSEAALLEQFPAHSGNGTGKGLDVGFHWSGRVMRCRAVAVPFSSGCAQFVLTCGADEFKTGQQTLGAILTSFQRTSATATSQ